MDKSKIEKILAPVEVARMRARERNVRQEFWTKFKSFAAQLPFAETVAASYFCAMDSKTPLKVRGTLLAALAYFILPFDAVPDFLAFVGFGDDIAVLTTAISMVQNHVTDEHRAQAKAALEQLAADPVEN